MAEVPDWYVEEKRRRDAEREARRRVLEPIDLAGMTFEDRMAELDAQTARECDWRDECIAHRAAPGAGS